MLVILTVLGVALLSLSAVSLRSSSIESAEARARANARMALMMAIGELQQHAGSDTRITAPASILNGESASSADDLAVIGVWKSWEGSDHESTGAAAARPIAPDYDSKRRPASSSDGRFLSWLVSMPQQTYQDDLISDAPGWSAASALQDIVRTIPAEGFVPMLSTGSLSASDPRQVHVKPVDIIGSSGQRGTYAWWVSGENQKACLTQPYKPRTDDAAGWSGQVKSHTAPDPETLGLKGLLEDPENFTPDPNQVKPGSKVFTLASTELIAKAPDTPHQNFHDLSTSAVGLLTNTATGGWRKDLSLFTENWDLLPDSGATVFQLTPSTTATMTKPKRTEVYSDITPAGSVFYPWSRHRVPPSGDQIRQRAWSAAVTSWHHLKDFSTIYKEIELQNGKPVLASRLTWADYHGEPITTGGKQDLLWTKTLTGEEISRKQAMFDYLHKARVIPVLAKTHFVYSLRALADTSGNNPGKYNLQIGTTPVATLWNPYNITLKTVPQRIQFPRALPPAFRFRVGGQQTDYHYQDGGSGSFEKNLTYQENGSYPRAYWVKYSVTGDSRINVDATASQTWRTNPKYFQLMKPGVTMAFTVDNSLNNVGYQPTDATYANVGRRLAPGGEAGAVETLAFDAGDNVRIDARFDAISEKYGARPPLVGAYVNVGNPLRNTARHMDPSSLQTRVGHTTATANTLWPPMAEGEFPSYTVTQLLNNPMPFLSMTLGSRQTNEARFPAKGALQSNPLVSQIEMGEFGLQQNHGQLLYGSTLGMVNTVNSAYDFSFLSHSSWSDSRLPNSSLDGENRGYIATGNQSGDGLSRLVTVELPLRPLGSLAELQHWGLRDDNNVPPYQSNVIANSDAQPLFEPDAVTGSNADSYPATNLQHDDSYCANHLLFDDWFFSTIAPQPASFGPTGKTLQETYTAFVSDGAPLDNRAYRPILEDAGSSNSRAATLFTAEVNTATAYQTIASRLEVEGMFNVNSTSVKAWRALLGHARNQRMPYYNNNGELVLSEPTDFAVSRSTVASDVEAGKNGSSGTFPGASEYSGYRVFTDEMLDRLAEEMVRQVRLRGPFLSLSEFVNRKLTQDDKELALAGAVQSALNVLANENDDLNPYAELQANSLNTGLGVLTANGNQLGCDFQNFPEAAEGKTAYGMPGWPRQADLLRPLAPILSARDDSFTIRAYGDARDASGQVIASAWCEAVVRRTRDFVSSEDEADTTTTLSSTNQRFGRRFEMTSFRWLNANEI